MIPGSIRLGMEILQVGGLLHDVLAGEIVAALLERLQHRFCSA